MSGEAPFWVWIVVAVIGSGFMTALAPVVIQALKGKERTDAEVDAIRADTLGTLQPIWNETVKYLEGQISQLRAELDRERTELQLLRQRLDTYEHLLIMHGVPIPDP